MARLRSCSTEVRELDGTLLFSDAVSMACFFPVGAALSQVKLSPRLGVCVDVFLQPDEFNNKWRAGKPIGSDDVQAWIQQAAGILVSGVGTSSSRVNLDDDSKIVGGEEEEDEDEDALEPHEQRKLKTSPRPASPKEESTRKLTVVLRLNGLEDGVGTIWSATEGTAVNQNWEGIDLSCLMVYEFSQGPGDNVPKVIITTHAGFELTGKVALIQNKMEVKYNGTRALMIHGEVVDDAEETGSSLKHSRAQTNASQAESQGKLSIGNLLSVALGGRGTKSWRTSSDTATNRRYASIGCFALTNQSSHSKGTFGFVAGFESEKESASEELRTLQDEELKRLMFSGAASNITLKVVGTCTLLHGEPCDHQLVMGRDLLRCQKDDSSRLPWKDAAWNVVTGRQSFCLKLRVHHTVNWAMWEGVNSISMEQDHAEVCDLVSVVQDLIEVRVEP